MKLSIKSIHLNNHILKIISLIFGYTFWFALIQNQKITTDIEIPLCFYGLSENLEIISPENIKVSLNAKRTDLNNINIKLSCAAHLDISKFTIPGQYNIAITNNDIFLHNKFKLIEYFPSTISIIIKEKK